MRVGSDQWSAALAQGLCSAGIQLNRLQLYQLSRHAQSLVEWNRKINLTAITDPVQMLIKHYLDTLLPSDHIPCRGHLLDMGTGGGFPGIPLKILRPDQPMTLVDASRKKISFIKHVIRQLELKNISAIQTRVEQMRQDSDYSGKFQVLVSRAFTQIDRIVEMALPLLADQGVIITYQGPDEQARKLSSRHVANQSISAVPYKLPDSGGDRTLVLMRQ